MVLYFNVSMQFTCTSGHVNCRALYVQTSSQKINGYVGYRSPRAKKNKDTWLFAHDYCGKLWKKLGAVLLILTIIVQIPFIHSSENTIGIMTVVLESVQVAVMLVSIVSVEKALNRTFDSNGVKR